jgi:hypothetical protein
MEDNSFNIRDHQKFIPTNILSKAKKLIVRECDEEEKGKFVAYVDDKDESRDVAIRVDARGMITEMQCDCTAGGKLCIHLAALIRHISDQKKEKRSRIQKSAKNPFETVLEEADEKAIREWLAEMLSKHQDLQLNFLSRFSKTIKTYTPEEVASLSLQGRKAIIKSRKKADASEIKRIVGLWEELLSPVIDSYLSDPASRNGFEAFRAVIFTTSHHMWELRITGSRMEKFIGFAMDKLNGKLPALQDEDVWHQSTEYLLDWVSTEPTVLSQYILEKICQLSVNAPFERRVGFARRLLDKYSANKDFRDGSQYKSRTLLIKMADECGIFGDYVFLFPPITWENEYNTAIVRSLIGLEMYERAEKICLEQIQKNTEIKYDRPYQQLLKEIYKGKGDLERYYMIVQDLLPITFDINEYEELMAYYARKGIDSPISQQMLDISREEVLTGNMAAAPILYRILEQERNYEVMIEYFSILPCCYPEWVDGFREMFARNPKGVLMGLVNKNDATFHYLGKSQQDRQDKAIIQLFELVSEAYEPDVIHRAIETKRKGNYYQYGSRFVHYVIAGRL